MSPERIEIEDAIKNTIALLLAGGYGKRLRPLTDEDCKPHIGFGGKWKLIDVVLNNLMHSQFGRIIMFPQYLFDRLEEHIDLGWGGIFRPERGEYLRFCSPREGTSDGYWTGTANSVFHNLDIVSREKPQYVLIAPADAIYKMDYRPFLQAHLRKRAKLTIAALQTQITSAKDFGVLEVNSDQKIIGFEEKPVEPKPMPGKPEFALASMGLYIFDYKTLYNELMLDAANFRSNHDFGKNIIPSMVERGQEVYAYLFEDDNCLPGYWRDVGSLDAFYEANMDLLRDNPPFPLFDRGSDGWSWCTRRKQLAPPYFKSVQLEGNSIVAEGCVLDSCLIKGSIIFPKVRVARGAQVIDSIVMEGSQIGENSVINRSILDENSRIQAGVRIDPDSDIGQILPIGEKNWVISEGGILVVSFPEEVWKGE